MTATMTSKNQFTMPKEIRERFGLVPGDRLDFVVMPDGEVAVRPIKRKSMAAFLDKARRPPLATVSIEEMDFELVRRATEEDERIRSHRA